MSGPKPLILGSRHLAILEAVWRYRCLTALDLLYLCGLSLNSLPYLRRLLGELCGGADYAERQYLYRMALPQTRVGGTEKVYFLGSRGRDYLSREEGLPVAWYWRPGKARHFSYQALLHDLTVSRLLIALTAFTKDHPSLRVADMRTQYELAKDPRLTQPADTRASGKNPPGKVVPDAWVNVIVKNGPQEDSLPLLLEVDRGTTFSKVFKERLLARRTFIRPQGPYKRIFGTEAVTIVYLTTAGAARRDTMARWAQEALEASKLSNWAEVFLFGEVEFSSLYTKVKSLLFEPHFYRPGSQTPVCLFD